jgi:hypothetical protein
MGGMRARVFGELADALVRLSATIQCNVARVREDTQSPQIVYDCVGAKTAAYQRALALVAVVASCDVVITNGSATAAQAVFDDDVYL